MDHAAVTNRAASPPDEKAPPPWWTEADDAELAALVWELVDEIFEHRPQCASCAAVYPPCPHIGRAIQIVIDWYAGRELLSRARRLRWERELIDYQRDLLILRRSRA